MGFDLAAQGGGLNDRRKDPNRGQDAHSRGCQEAALVGQGGSQDRHNSFLQIGTLDHRKSQERGGGVSAPRDFEQVTGVLRWADAHSKHGLVAGLLAVSYRQTRRKPAEGVEPIQCEGQVTQQLASGVVAPHVHEFV